MKIKSFLRLSTILLLVLVLLPVQPGGQAADHTYTVVSTLNSGVGTLRWAINQANTHTDPTDNITIDFNIPEIDPNYDDETGVWTITVVDSALPPLITGNTTINGYSQEGAGYGTSTRSPTLVVVLDGFSLPENIFSFGLGIASSNNEIMGLVIQNFPSNGIAIGFPEIEVTNNIITGNCIGTDYECAHDEGNGGDGVFIGYGAKNNIIGVESPEGKNIILFNGLDGVGIHGSGTDGNLVIGNIIFSNTFHGVFIYGGAQNNTIGGDTEGERNLISANHKDGVRIHGLGTNENAVAGNYIGTSSDGNIAIPNSENGVQIMLGAQENIIGGGTTGTGNLISGNVLSGVMITGTNTMSNTVSGNYIGANFDTSAEMPNLYGVQITSGAQYNQVGGDSENERNIISGNNPWGVNISGSGTSFNVVSGNYIGTDASGSEALANQDGGVYVSNGATDNQIGGSSADEGNLISGNGEDGIVFDGAETSSNYVIGNYIGTDFSGTAAIANNESGVNVILGAHDIFIGGDSAGEGNLISGNGEQGVWISGGDTYSNTVYGNLIGTEWQGAAALGNTKSGVVISGGAYNNTVGGDTEGARNLISGNGFSGVDLLGAGTIDNRIFGNYIGTTISGTAAISNTYYGVYVFDGATENLIGGQYGLTGNLISGNGDSGVRISGSDTMANTVAGNLIGPNAMGDDMLDSIQEKGISIRHGANHNLVGGIGAGARNVISGNELGLLISDTLTSENDILGNYIGTDPSGTEMLGNYIGVLLAGGAQNNTIGSDSAGERNILSGNYSSGAAIINTSSTGNVLSGNYIGVDVSGSAALSNGYGVVLFDTVSNIVGPNNVIAWNPAAGILVRGAESLDNTLTRNSMYYNTIGITLEDGAHGDIAAPVIIDTDDATQITGTACAGCTVEVFESFYGHGQGETFIGSTTADGSGNFSLTSVSFSHNFLSATATDAALGTSEFSAMYTVNPMLYLPLVMR